MSQVQTVKVYAEIKGFPNYSVAPDGEVFSINRGRPLKWYRGKGCERPHVTLFNNGVSSKLFLLLKHLFLILNLMYINMLDIKMVIVLIIIGLILNGVVIKLEVNTMLMLML